LVLNIDDNFHGVFEFLEHVKNHFFPRQWGFDPEMQQTITAAFARLKLDYPEQSEALTPEELAALARVGRKSVMNLVAPGKRGILQKDSDDRITIDSATRWLLARDDFRPSVWQRQKGKMFRRPTSESSSIEPLFVPVASDGSWFSPVDRSHRDGKYYIANGEAEQKFENYWDALELITRAASPRWRYTDAAGRWRIKAMTRWERKARQEVEALLLPTAERMKT